MILDHFNRKMDILDHFWGPLNSLLPKSHDISAFKPMDPLKPVKTLSKPYFLTILDPFFEGPVRGCGY